MARGNHIKSINTNIFVCALYIRNNICILQKTQRQQRGALYNYIIDESNCLNTASSVILIYLWVVCDSLQKCCCYDIFFCSNFGLHINSSNCVQNALNDYLFIFRTIIRKIYYKVTYFLSLCETIEITNQTHIILYA